jgi:putative acetyltransferase
MILQINSHVHFQLRPICIEDNEIIARIIRTTLVEFNANQPGSAFDDKSTDNLFTLFQTPSSAYFVVELQNKIVGGIGIYPTNGLPADTCELVRMYLIPEARGLGIGKILLDKCINTAKEAGYRKIYLETKPQLQQALKIYEQYGFKKCTKPLGNSGHYGCEIWMIKII